MSKKGTKSPTMRTTDLKLEKAYVRVSSLVQATAKALSIQAKDSGMRPRMVGMTLPGIFRVSACT